jgi:hypothetical protein
MKQINHNSLPLVPIQADESSQQPRNLCHKIHFNIIHHTIPKLSNAPFP